MTAEDLIYWTVIYFTIWICIMGLSRVPVPVREAFKPLEPYKWDILWASILIVGAIVLVTWAIITADTQYRMPFDGPHRLA